MPRVTATVAELFFIGGDAFLLTLLFTRFKTTWHTASNSHCLAALPAKTSAFNSYSGETPTALT